MLILCLLWGTADASVQPLERIAGEVVDEATGKPLPGATVVLTGTRRGAIADQEGSFVIEQLAPGRRLLRVSMVGYRAEEVTVTVPQQQTLQVRLHTQALVEEEVVITATRTEKFRRDVPVIVQIVDDQLLGATESFGLADGLAFQSGLRVETSCQNCGVTQVRLNGLDGNYSQILIDGRPVFSALNGVYGLDHLPAAMIDRVEVVRGGGSALFGANAIAGTINVITREPIDNGFELSLAQSLVGGEEPERHIQVSGTVMSADQRTGVALFGVLRDRSPYDHDGDGFSELARLHNNSFGLRGFYRLSPLSKITLELHSLYEDRRGGNRFAYQPHEADIAEAAQHRILGGSAAYETFLTGRSEQRLTGYLSFQQTERDSYYGAGRDPLAYGYSENLTLVAGGQYSILPGRMPDNEFTFGMEGSSDHLQDDAPGYARFTDQSIRQVGVFAQSDWKIDNTFSLLLGLRADYHSRLDDPVLNPRANLLINLTDKLQARVSGATGFRAPQIFDEDLHITAVGGEGLLIENAPDLGAERSLSFSGSVDYSGRSGTLPWGVTLEGFYTRLTDAFVLEEGARDAADNIVMWRRNGSGARVFGTTLQARVFLSGELQMQAGLTLQNSRYEEPVEWAEGRFFDGFLRAPEVYGYYAATLALTPAFSLSLSGVYTGSMRAPHYAGYIEEDRLEKTRTFLETNLKLDLDLDIGPAAPEMKLFVGVHNLFDQYQNDFDQGVDRDAGYIYGPGRPRTLYSGIRFAY